MIRFYIWFLLQKGSAVPPALGSFDLWSIVFQVVSGREQIIILENSRYL